MYFNVESTFLALHSWDLTLFYSWNHAQLIMPFVSFGLVLVPAFLAMPFVLPDKWITSDMALEEYSRHMACQHSNLYIAQDVFGGMS